MPKKNIKELNGKPLIAHTILQAKNSKKITRVIVSTDDSKIADISKKYGAEVVIRPDELATDASPTEPTLIHVINYLKEKENYHPDYIVLLQCTSPIREKDDIDKAFETLEKENADSLLSVTKNKGFLWKIEKGNAISINYDYKNRPIRQDKEWDFVENGSIYIIKTDLLLNYKNRLYGKIALYIMEDWKSYDIDNEFDFFLLEQLIKFKKLE